jgi:hypothetical protein
MQKGVILRCGNRSNAEMDTITLYLFLFFFFFEQMKRIHCKEQKYTEATRVPIILKFERNPASYTTKSMSLHIQLNERVSYADCLT